MRGPTYAPLRTLAPGPASGEGTYDRLFANGFVSSPTGRLRVTYFRAERTEQVSVVRTYSGGTAAAATPSLCRIGVWSVDETTWDGTLVASIASDTSLWDATGTEYESALTAGFRKVAGAYYAVATLCVTATTAPTLAGYGGPAAMADTLYRPQPRCGFVDGMSDLPDPLDYSGLTATANAIYAELA